MFIRFSMSRSINSFNLKRISSMSFCKVEVFMEIDYEINVGVDVITVDVEEIGIAVTFRDALSPLSPTLRRSIAKITSGDNDCCSS